MDILPNEQNAPPAWNPQPGDETAALNRPADTRDQVVDEARRTLMRCVPPDTPDEAQTGLVIRYVQSGKTMSFMTLAALARENDYRLIIAITGTSKPLFNQSRQRLICDLRLETRTGFNPWRHVSQPHVASNSHTEIQDTLAEWTDPSVPPGERHTVLITVNKNHTRLQQLVDVLTRLDMRCVPTIIIDDEGDQAGLNTQVNDGTESTTYARLLDIMAALPHHSYLQAISQAVRGR